MELLSRLLPELSFLTRLRGIESLNIRPDETYFIYSSRRDEATDATERDDEERGSGRDCGTIKHMIKPLNTSRDRGRRARSSFPGTYNVHPISQALTLATQ